MFWGSHSDVAKDAILLGCDTQSVNEQLPIFQTTYCLHVQGAKQCKVHTVTTTHCTEHYNLLWCDIMSLHKKVLMLQRNAVPSPSGSSSMIRWNYWLSDPWRWRRDDLNIPTRQTTQHHIPAD